MKKLLKMILSRTSFILLLLLLQIALFFVILTYVSQYRIISVSMYGISIMIVMYLLYNEENPIYKLSWIIPILLFPLFGGVFYLFYRQRNVSKKQLNKFMEIEKERYAFFHQSQQHKIDHNISKYMNYNNYISDFHTSTTFLASGEQMFEAMKRDLSQAKKYIFLEFFIIKHGKMWSDILNILKEKASQGIEIYLLYDDFGSSSLASNYKKTLQSFNIHAAVFNPMRIHLNFAMNYRDHQKLVIIDGKLAYTGGINIGDEYINLEHPFGHWKDAGIKLEGPAVSTLVYNYCNVLKFTSDINIAPKDYIHSDFDLETQQSMVIPFSDNPIDQELVNKNIYMSMIMQAKKEIYITTPYLIIDSELSTALKLASKSGVQVNIIIPYIPDKKIVFMVTESYADELMHSGVNVYQYKPGFIHSKMIIVDQEIAMIGTANLDFRSLYLHFENSVYLENKKTIQDMHDFCLETIDESVLMNDLKPRPVIVRILKVLLRGFASIM